MNTIIRKIRPEEHNLLREFLYQAIYLPEGVEPPPRSVVDLPEYRGRGIGTQLLTALLRLLRENGYRQVSLSVQKENPALRLYQRTGFRILAETGTEYLMLWDNTQGGVTGEYGNRETA